MDEPASALDPIATSKIEELIYELKDNYTIVIVTHNMQQAARVSDPTGLLLARASWSKCDRPTEIFTNPREADRRLHHRTVRLEARHGRPRHRHFPRKSSQR